MHLSDSGLKLVQRLLTCIEKSADFDLLQEVNLLLSHCPKEEVQLVFKDVSLEQVINSIPWDDSDTCSEALKLMQYISEHKLIGDIWQHIGLISAGLFSAEEEVLIFLSKEIGTSFQQLNEAKGQQVSVPSKEMVTHLLHQLVNTLGHESPSVFSAAKSTLLTFANSEQQVVYLFGEPNLRSAWTQLCEKKENRLRVFEFLIEMVAGKPFLFHGVIETGLLSECANSLLQVEIFAHDPLIELNCIELLGDLAEIRPEGWEFVCHQGFLERVTTLAQGIEEDFLRLELTLPGYVKFFGRIARHDYEMAQRLSPLKVLLQESLENAGDFSRQLLAIETVAHMIRDTTQTRELLERDMGDFLTACLNEVGHLCTQGHAPAPVRCRALDAWAALLTCPTQEDASNIMEAVTERWFLIIARKFVSGSLPASATNPQIQQKALTSLRTVAEQPFLELRVAVLRLFSVMTPYKWGLQAFHNTAGFEEYLMNRGTEKEKEGRQLKYALVCGIVHSPAFHERIFGPEFTLKLREYVNQGPFFVRTEARVALEDAD